MPRLWLLWAILAGLVIVGLILWAALVDAPLRLDTRGVAPTDRLKAQNDLRGTLVTLLGGVAVLLGAIVAALGLRETSRQNRAVLELQRRGQVTERFTRAIEQLGQGGPEKIDVRIGAAYALEQIARDSTELHWPIMEVLTAFLREHAYAPPPDDIAEASPDPEGAKTSGESRVVRTPADVQAIATVIGRRRQALDPTDQRLDLQWVDLREVQWKGAGLARVDLFGALLERADLRNADLRSAELSAADLRGADLSKADLRGAFLSNADLRSCYVDAADLRRAILCGAYLRNADLRNVDFRTFWTRAGM